MAKKKQIPTIKLNQNAVKIREQWNALKPSQKRDLYKADPARVIKIRDKFYDNRFEKEGKEIVSLENKFGRELKGAELREANKLHHDFLKQEAYKKQLAKDEPWFKKVREAYKEKLKDYKLKQADKKLKKIREKYGITEGQNILMEHGVPNTDLMKMGKDYYAQIKKDMNAIAGKDSLKPRELQEETDKEWEEALAKVDEINRNSLEFGRQTKLNAVNEAKVFMHDRYFKNARDEKMYQDIIDAHLEHLTVDQLYEVMDILTNPLFMKEWDSDQDAENYDPEWREKRQWDFIQILQNTTGYQYEVVDSATGELKRTKWQNDGSSFQWNNYN